jgi:hypothetical protein
MHYFNVRLRFQPEYRFGLVRQGDKLLMSEFIRVGYKRMDLLSLNIVQMYKMVIHLSDVVKYDGKTIKKSMLLANVGKLEAHKFPVQRPMPTDMNLWTTALQRISSEFYVLTLPLQEYISIKHLKPSWQQNQNGDILHHNIKMNGQDYHVEYTPMNNPLAQQTCSGRRFQHNVTKVGYSKFPIFASIMHLQLGQVLLHSTVAAAIPSVASLDFETNLRSYGNETLWKSLD